MTRIALCFPGQGSQARGMASGLLGSPLAAELAGVAAERDLDLRGLLSGDDEVLRPTAVAQPCLVFTELVLAAALPTDLEVVGVAGHSVGEYAALCVAGAYSPATALRLVIERGRAMAAMTEGTMAAVLGLDAETVEELCGRVTDAGDTVVVANLNAPGQVVISGSLLGVERAAQASRDAGARRVLRLNVSGAFHSPLMHNAAQRFAALIDATRVEDLHRPVVCNVDGAVVGSAADVPDRLRRQMEAPVRWAACVERLRSLGAELLVEVGPGSVLSGLAKRIAPDVGTTTVATLEGARGLGPLVAAG